MNPSILNPSSSFAIRLPRRPRPRFALRRLPAPSLSGVSSGGSVDARTNCSTPSAYSTAAAGALQLADFDATATLARFRTTRGIAVDAAGNIHVADNGNSTIRKITYYGVVPT